MAWGATGIEFSGALLLRNWVVDADGVLQFEGVGFGSDGNEWMKRANEMIEKVNSSRKVKDSR